MLGVGGPGPQEPHLDPLQVCILFYYNLISSSQAVVSQVIGQLQIVFTIQDNRRHWKAIQAENLSMQIL